MSILEQMMSAADKFATQYTEGEIAAMLAAERQIKTLPQIKPSFADQLKRQMDIGDRFGNNGHPVHDKPDGRKWTKAQKMVACPRNGGWCYGVMKIINGKVKRKPRHCHMCEGCLKAEKAEWIEEKTKDIEYYDALAKHATEGDGHWRVKVVDEDKEAKALKKRVNRNQDGRHVEIACEKPGKTKMFSFIANDTANPDDYGEPGSPLDEDMERVHNLMKKSDNKKKGITKGKGFGGSKPAGKDKEKKETIKVITPEIIVEGGKEASMRAGQIAEETNYIKEAKTAQGAIELFAYQTKLVIREIEKEGIKVAAVINHAYNYEAEYVLKAWNSNVRERIEMSRLDALPNNDNATKVDRLYYPDWDKKVYTQ